MMSWGIRRKFQLPSRYRCLISRIAVEHTVAANSWMIKSLVMKKKNSTWYWSSAQICNLLKFHTLQEWSYVFGAIDGAIWKVRTRQEHPLLTCTPSWNYPVQLRGHHLLHHHFFYLDQAYASSWNPCQWTLKTVQTYFNLHLVWREHRPPPRQPYTCQLLKWTHRLCRHQITCLLVCWGCSVANYYRSSIIDPDFTPPTFID